MLDIRTTTYISPLSEVPFKSVPLTVHIVNVADETGLVTGKFRVYNVTTGLLIHTSDIAPLTLTAGTSTDASALTDFDPPAPADDTYFVLFDGIASNALVPDGITLQLGVFHFDVKPVGMGPAPAAHAGTHENGGSDELDVTDLGTSELDDTLVLQPDGAGGVEWAAGGGGGAPAAHAASHENTGSDEISVAGLSGVLTDPQTPAAHNHSGDDLKFAKVHPAADATTALQILKADDATVVLNVDTTNLRVGIGQTTPTAVLHVENNDATILLLLKGNATFNPALKISDGITIAKLQVYAGGGPAALFGTETNHHLAIYSNNTERIRVDKNGSIGIGTTAPSTLFDVNSDKIRLRTAKTPANAGDTGNAGDICWDANYIYVCTATNTWKRAAIATW